MSYLRNFTESIQQKGVARHFLFWIGIILLTIPQNVLESDQPFIDALVYKLCVLIPQVLSSYFVAYFVIPMYVSKKKYVVSLFLIIIGTYFFAALSRVFIIHIGETLVRTPPFEQETILEIITQLRFFVIVLCTTYLFYSFYFSCCKIFYELQRGQRKRTAI